MRAHARVERRIVRNEPSLEARGEARARARVRACARDGRIVEVRAKQLNDSFTYIFTHEREAASLATRSTAAEPTRARARGLGDGFNLRFLAAARREIRQIRFSITGWSRYRCIDASIDPASVAGRFDQRN
jgi:hypothetical protein